MTAARHAPAIVLRVIVISRSTAQPPRGGRSGNPALANSTRRAILARLTEGEATVNELAAPFEMTLPSISKHIKVLQQAGLVTRGHHAQYRPCALDATPFEEVATWAEQYRRVWEARFDRMGTYLRQLRAEPRAGGHDE